MATYMESLCCQDTNVVSEELGEGQKCITKPSRFKIVCMEKPVLNVHYQPLIIYVVILWKIWTIVHIDLQDTSNILLGCISIWGKVLQSHSIMYHIENDVYITFMESKENEERRLNTDD